VDEDHPSMPALCEELQVSRKTVYYHLRLHPDYDRLMVERTEMRRRTGTRTPRRARVQAGVAR
jgi:hypothetical protein